MCVLDAGGGAGELAMLPERMVLQNGSFLVSGRLTSSVAFATDSAAANLAVCFEQRYNYKLRADRDALSTRLQ